MEKLPREVKMIIGEYLFTCKKNDYFINREFNKIFKHQTKDCKKIHLCGKVFCKKCETEKIVRLRMILNNLLPG